MTDSSPHLHRLSNGQGNPTPWAARARLPEGPLDLVGDVHGEITALEGLLHHLGYWADGTHADGRRLVFLGDLVDRGPDSPAVVRRVRDLVNHGGALAVMGNHDLHAVRRKKKSFNTWLLGHGPVESTETPVGSERERDEIIAFLRTLPLALERDDLRVVHACWDDEALALLQLERDPGEALVRHHDRVAAGFAAHADEVSLALAHQNQNPVRVITSGPEMRAPAPFFSAGRVRTECRRPWWDEYDDGPFVVFGHYSRVSIPEAETGTDLFVGQLAGCTLGPGRAMCIDYSVGGRAVERELGRADGSYTGRLAALRWPEHELVFDDGESRPLVDREGQPVRRIP